MKWSTLNRDQKIVTVTTIMTALMHLLFSYQWSDYDVFGMNLMFLFIINGIGYLVLGYLYGLGDQMDGNLNLVRYLLVAWTLGTIVGWVLEHPGDTLLDQSLGNKVVEFVLLIFLAKDIMSNKSSTN